MFLTRGSRWDTHWSLTTERDKKSEIYNIMVRYLFPREKQQFYMSITPGIIQCSLRRELREMLHSDPANPVNTEKSILLVLQDSVCSLSFSFRQNMYEVLSHWLVFAQNHVNSKAGTTGGTTDIIWLASKIEVPGKLHLWYGMGYDLWTKPINSGCQSKWVNHGSFGSS